MPEWISVAVPVLAIVLIAGLAIRGWWLYWSDLTSAKKAEEDV